MVANVRVVTALHALRLDLLALASDLFGASGRARSPFQLVEVA